jgi:hypothetical protein
MTFFSGFPPRCDMVIEIDLQKALAGKMGLLIKSVKE